MPEIPLEQLVRREDVKPDIRVLAMCLDLETP